MAELLSVVIIARNAAAQLPDCLRSVAFADEVLVVDSGSDDDTVATAERAGARVIYKEWLGFGPQKQFAVGQARHDWVLCLDADERVSPELKSAITQTLAAPRYRAFDMPRRNRFMGRWLKHGEGYPDYNLRLFHRAHARWSDDAVHEHVIAATPVGRLRGDLLHESEVDIATYLDKQNRYTSLQAHKMFAAGKRATIFNLVSNPLLRFVRMYLFRLGMLDGVPGLIHIGIGCFNTFIKYSKLRELQRRV